MVKYSLEISQVDHNHHRGKEKLKVRPQLVEKLAAE